MSALRTYTTSHAMAALREGRRVVVLCSDRRTANNLFFGELRNCGEHIQSVSSGSRLSVRHVRSGGMLDVVLTEEHIAGGEWDVGFIRIGVGADRDFFRLEELLRTRMT